LGQDFQATLWIGLDSIHELMDWIGLGQQKWTHVQLWFTEPQHWQRQRNVTELTRCILTACYSAIPKTHFCSTMPSSSKISAKVDRATNVW